MTHVYCLRCSYIASYVSSVRYYTHARIGHHYYRSEDKFKDSCIVLTKSYCLVL